MYTIHKEIRYDSGETFAHNDGKYSTYGEAVDALIDGNYYKKYFSYDVESNEGFYVVRFANNNELVLLSVVEKK